MNSRTPLHQRDYMPPLTDRELEIIGPPPPFFNFEPIRANVRSGYLCHSRITDTMRMEMHRLDRFNRGEAREQQRTMEMEWDRMAHMAPLREEFMERPDMYESQEEESEDEKWLEEWNRGMREIEREIEAGDYEFPKRPLSPFPTVQRRGIFKTKPSKQYKKKKESKEVPVDTPKRKRGRPRKNSTPILTPKSTPPVSREPSAFRIANPRLCVKLSNQ